MSENPNEVINEPPKEQSPQQQLEKAILRYKSKPEEVRFNSTSPIVHGNTEYTQSWYLKPNNTTELPILGVNLDSVKDKINYSIILQYDTTDNYGVSYLGEFSVATQENGIKFSVPASNDSMHFFIADVIDDMVFQALANVYKQPMVHHLKVEDRQRHGQLLLRGYKMSPNSIRDLEKQFRPSTND